jgi:hypothetical protein
MSQEDDIIKSLIAGGIIGAGLGALLTGDKRGTTLGAIAGAALLATLKASQEAESRHFPMYVVENDALYEVQPDGSRVLVRSFDRKKRHYNSNYTLK